MERDGGIRPDAVFVWFSRVSCLSFLDCLNCFSEEPKSLGGASDSSPGSVSSLSILEGSCFVFF